MVFRKKKYCAIIVLFILQCDYIIQSSCDCIVKLTDIDIQSSKSPLILKPPNSYQGLSYQYPNYKLEFLYPAYVDSNCLIAYVVGLYNSLLISLACPGNTLQFPNFPNASIEATNLIREDNRSYYDSPNNKPTPSGLFVPEFPTPFSRSVFNSTPIKCSGVIEPRMKEISEDAYQIGIQVSVLDFVPVISLYSNVKTSMITARAKVLPINERRPKIAEDTNFLKGLLYKNAFLEELNEFYSKEYQVKEFSNIFPKYMGDNYLVKGQLISKDDLFYIPQQKCTFFYDNTVPVWKSINDGNWKKVSEIIRKLAHQSIKELDIYSGAFGKGNLKLDGVPYYFNIPKQLSSTVSNFFVPEVLFKVIYDPRNEQRSIAFLTINDPYVIVDSNGKINNENTACCKKSECHYLYPEFLNSTKGYTCCCSLKDFKVPDTIKNF